MGTKNILLGFYFFQIIAQQLIFGVMGLYLSASY